MIINYTEAASAVGGSESDPTLQRVVRAIDADVKGFLAPRLLEWEPARDEVLRGYGTPTVFLQLWPVTRIAEVRVDATGVLGDDTIVEQIADIDDLTLGVARFAVRNGALTWLDGNFPEGPETVSVLYAGGFWPADGTDDVPTHVPKMPEDIRDAALELFVERWSSRATGLMKSESIGGYSYTRDDRALTSGLPARVQRILSRYRRLL